MSDFDNVKLLIRDKNGKYLVGRRYDKDYKYSSLGGHKERNENIYQTLNRELYEETSRLLKLGQDKDRKLYLSDGKYRYPVSSTSQKQIGKQVYVLINVSYDLNEDIKRWKDKFRENQEDLLLDTITDITEVYPEIPVIQWFKYILKYKDDYDDKELSKILEKWKLNKRDIRYLKNKFEELGYYLEMDDLDLVPLEKLRERYGLYERNFVEMLR